MIKIYLIWNIFVFLIYGFDKLAAKRGMRRISEKTLLITAFFMGGIGAFFGMEIFRHKTKHLSFKILVPVFSVVNVIVLYFLLNKMV